MPARIVPSRSKWHLLFATGSVEQVEDDKGRTSRVSWNESALREMVSAREQMDTHATRLGTQRQPWPVSLQHAIERRLYFAEQIPDENLIRMGNGYGLFYHPGGSANGENAPAGLYGLIEWTPRGLAEIEDGQSITLSPTTHRKPRTTDGRTFGQTVVAVGLVDSPKLDTIGTAREGLPWDTFTADVVPLDKSENAGTVAAYWRQGMRRAVHQEHSGVVMRAALTIEEAMDENEKQAEDAAVAEIEAAAADPAPVKRSMDEIFEEIDADDDMRAAACKRYGATPAAAEMRADEDGSLGKVGAMLETVIGRLDRIESLVGKATANSSDAADAAELAADASLMAEARRAASDRARDIVLRHVREGSLVGSDKIREARARIIRGEEIGDLVVTRAAHEPKPSGTPSGSLDNGAAPDVSGPRSVKHSDVRAEIRRALPKIDGFVDPVREARETMARISELRAQGVEIIGE